MRQLKNLLPLKQLLAEVLKPKMPSEKDFLFSLEHEWTGLVGSHLGRKSFPLKLHGKKLVIGVSGSVWAQELDCLKQDLLEKIHTTIPLLPLEEIRFKVVSKFRTGG